MHSEYGMSILSCKLGEDPSAGSSSDLMAMHGSSQGLQQVFESKDQRNKLIHVLLSYAKEIAGENLASDLLEAGDNLRAIAEAVVAEPRNEEFLMQLLRISVAACGSLSGEVSEEQSGLQHYISQLVFELCDEIIGVEIIRLLARRLRRAPPSSIAASIETADR